DNPQPPALPEAIPLGIYRRSFSVPADWAGREVFLNLCGAKSGVYVYLNGKEVGYNEDSKDLVRFPLNAFLKEGENELEIRCWRWSTGSWLECQDFWRISGIERDVYLSSEKPLAPEDFRVVSTLDRNCSDGLFTLEVSASVPVAYKLMDKDGSTVASGTAPIRNLRIPAVRKWSAETPELYTLLLEAEGEYTRFDVGFRRLEIKGNVFYVNGQPVKFKGVNFHEHNEFTGHYLTRAEILEHLRVMRSLNVNAIRTCHYPQQRAFYELCDSLGFYVYDEANVETHAMGYEEKSLAKHPEWYPKHLDRILNMYARTANYPCVTILSLGNEAGNGVNFERAYDVLKALECSGQNRPIVYERPATTAIPTSRTPCMPVQTGCANRACCRQKSP
ncbi:MAG: beta-galactosidase, partial [Bacteroidales bacterium]|nr:beta-galactosidase [Bacteroidales bacterium]